MDCCVPLLRRLSVFGLGLLFLLPTLSPSASAQAIPERANPPFDSAIPVMPNAIEVWFSEEVSAAGTTLQVFKLDGTQVDLGNAAIDAADSTHTRVTVGVHEGLDNGEYEVRWTAVSAIDGATTNGSYRFVVDPAASPAALPQIATQQAPAPLPAVDPTNSENDDPRLPRRYAMAAIAGLSIAALLFLWYFRRASRGRRWSDRPVDRL